MSGYGEVYFGGKAKSYLRIPQPDVGKLGIISNKFSFTYK